MAAQTRYYSTALGSQSVTVADDSDPGLDIQLVIDGAAGADKKAIVLAMTRIERELLNDRTFPPDAA